MKIINHSINLGYIALFSLLIVFYFNNNLFVGKEILIGFLIYFFFLVGSFQKLNKNELNLFHKFDIVLFYISIFLLIASILLSFYALFFNQSFSLDYFIAIDTLALLMILRVSSVNKRKYLENCINNLNQENIDLKNELYEQSLLIKKIKT